MLRRTAKKRIDYKLLHQKGIKVEKLVNCDFVEVFGKEAVKMADDELPTEEKTENAQIHTMLKDAKISVSSENAQIPTASRDVQFRMLKFQLRSLMEDIDDFIEENPVKAIEDCVTDLDAAIKRAEELRSMYRNLFKEIEAQLQDDEEEDYLDRLLTIKSYILNAKECKRLCRMKDMSGKRIEDKRRSEVFTFIVDDVERLMSELEGECVVDITNLDEKDLIRRNKSLFELENKIKIISDKFPEMLSYCTSEKDDELVEKFKKWYASLAPKIKSYSTLIKKRVDELELDKEDVFKASNLNIKLERFKGYSSPVDIYTFKSEFEKIYLRSTPRRMLPELLKNNFLGDSALSMVKSIDDIDEVWKRLREAFGDPKIMLERKLGDIDKINSLSKMKGCSKTIDGLQKVINLMKDLMDLSKKHDIENQLYYSDALERIVRTLGDSRATRWIAEKCDKMLSNKESWNNLVAFLEKDVKVTQQKMLFFRTDETRKGDTVDVRNEKAEKKFNSYHYGNMDTGDEKCSICGEDGHVATTGPNRSKLIQYFSCRSFVNMSPAERFATIKHKGLCWQCLFPGAMAKHGKHADGKCQRDFVCKHASHSSFKRRKHVLVCEEHKTSEENKKLLEEYKSRCITRENQVNLPDFSKEIKLAFHSNSDDDRCFDDRKESTFHVPAKHEAEKAIYQLQIIQVDGQDYSIFYDSGCGDFVSKQDAVKRIGSRASQERKGPIKIGGVGGSITESPHGIYSVKLPLFNQQEAFFTGVCLDDITCEFPKYPIKGAVERDIHDAYKKSGGSVENLPKLPQFVGGTIDFMIGIKYLRYHPRRIFQLPSGLTIYESMFRNSDGGRGVIGGPHEIFTAIEKQFYLQSNHQMTFLCNQEKLYRSGYQINPDVSLLGFKIDEDEGRILSENDTNKYLGHPSKEITKFEEAERCGSEITYRCIRCGSCKTCKECDITEAVSIKEEIEENLISNAVVIDQTNRMCTARLPFIMNPVIRLNPNRDKAMKVYLQQIKKLNRDPADKADVLRSERKLQELNFVDYVRNLTREQQNNLKDNQIQNFIPWRVVWKENSISRPCRLVFDASQPTSSGYSLNDVLAKGRNNLNKLQEILIRWLTHKVAFHSDIQKMYNCVKLSEEDWCYQRYLWHEDLEQGKIPEEKVIKTLIYGVRSSGNLAEHCIRKTASLGKEEFPEIDEIVRKDFYVDDCLSGEESVEMAFKRADQLETILNRGGFSLKGITFSGRRPPEELSEDGISLVVGGIRWYPEEDEISVNLGDMIFSKKQRGRKPKDVLINIVPEKLTRRHCVSKVSEVFDILGKFTPITAALKLDLHDLVLRQLNWDDTIPDSLRHIWKDNFEIIKEIKNVKYQRAVVPADAVDLNMETLEFGDASKSMLCVAIYVRFRRINGEYSCQLLFSRSKIIPDKMSQPRAELFAAVVNVHSGEIVKRSLYKYHCSSIKFTDSQIVLYWISNEDKTIETMGKKPSSGNKKIY